MSATQDEVNKQRAALLTAIATQGSAGKTAYEAEQARQAEYAKAAAASLSSVAAGPGTAPPAAFLAQLRAEAAAQQGVYAQDNQMAQTNYQNSMNQTAMSNAAYMDQARAAVPVVEAQTAGQIAQIRAQQEEQRLAREEAAKERAYNERMRALGLQEREQGDNVGAQKFLQDGQEKAREEYLRKTGIANESIGAALSDIVSSARTVDEAVQIAERVASEGMGEKEWRAKGPTFRNKVMNEIYRHIVGYFTGKTGSTDPQSLGYQIRKYGGDPTRVPGYRTADQRETYRATQREVAQDDYTKRLAAELAGSGIGQFNQSSSTAMDRKIRAAKAMEAKTGISFWFYMKD